VAWARRLGTSSWGERGGGVWGFGGGGTRTDVTGIAEATKLNNFTTSPAYCNAIQNNMGWDEMDDDSCG